MLELVLELVMFSELQKTYTFRNFFHWFELGFLVPGTTTQFNMIYLINMRTLQC